MSSVAQPDKQTNKQIKNAAQNHRCESEYFK